VEPPNGLPQGLTEQQFAVISAKVRDAAAHLAGHAQIHGSRASGTATADSDLDIAILVPPQHFGEIWREKFGAPNPGSAKFRTMQHAYETGKIQCGEAGLRALRKELESDLGIAVDISIIEEGGPFDQGPYLPLIGHTTEGTADDQQRT